MSFLTLDVSLWAEETFGQCDLHDVRRTRRAVKVAHQMALHPDGSSPAQTERWGDLKALYRLFDEEDVTFEALASPHWSQTRAQATGTVLLLGDTMETDFVIHRKTIGLGPTGEGLGRGFMLHSSLMVVAGTKEIVGLAGQELFYRKPAPRNENSYQALQRARESEVWGRVIDRVGSPAEGVRYIHVFDRGADTLDVFCHARQQQSDWIIRAAQLHRAVQDQQGESSYLQSLVDRQPVLGTYELAVREGKRQPARMARIEVRVAQATGIYPKRRTAYQKSVGFKSLTQWVVEAREVDPPKGADPLHWTLWTSLLTETFAEAWTIIKHYEARWLIEEYHKAVKTGCRLESRQYMEAHSL